MEQSEITTDSSTDVQLHPKNRLGLDAQQSSPIVTLMVEQILINPVWIRRSLGDKVQVGPELIRPNQIVNLMRGL